MRGEDDMVAMGKRRRLMLSIAVVFLMSHLWFFSPHLREALGIFSPSTDRITQKIFLKETLFGGQIPSKLLIAAILIVISLFEGAKKSWEKEGPWWIMCPISLLIFILFNGEISFIRSATIREGIYVGVMVMSFLGILFGLERVKAKLEDYLEKRGSNSPEESFLQEERLLCNEYSINYRTQYRFNGRIHNGWINLVNIFRATMVLGTPGSGKSFAIIEQYIRQCIEKGFAAYIYDFKYSDLTEVAYRHFLKNQKRYPSKARFLVVSFDDLRHSSRCNPLDARFLDDISDAYESAYTIMLNLNRSWIKKQGEFFVESPIVLLTAVIWFLRIYEKGKYCTFPHAIELLNSPYKDLFEILTSYPELESYMSAFIDAWKGGAQEQLQGQIASAKIPLSRIISPTLYWVMSASDFTLDLNSPTEPKILCMGNNPDRQNINSAALGLINSRIVRIMNKKKRLKSCIVIDELPTIYFRGLDNLIATARSNLVAVCLGIQDFSQLKRDYGEREATVICNTIGNVFSGQVVGASARDLSERFGRTMQQRRSVSYSDSGTSSQFSEQLEQMIPPSKIAALSPGEFVGEVADSFNQPIERKVFHAKILVNQKEKEDPIELPVTYDFLSTTGEDNMQRTILDNFFQIKEDVKRIIADELLRIRETDDLSTLRLISSKSKNWGYDKSTGNNSSTPGNVPVDYGN
ncbi:MAG: type IV secretion system DNA-binding domain-containing protein [Alistipes sp.]|nr:type IV secretion system DNA-binding domain-containing protein [Candidatus Alistipes equi]